MKHHRSSSNGRAPEIDATDKMLPFAFDLPSASLLFIDSEKQIINLGQFTKDAVLIGIDTETKPTFVPKHLIVGKLNPTALMQMAIRTASGSEKVFLVDLLKICGNSSLSFALDSALKPAMSSTTCIKIGQGLTNDLRELVEAYPNMKAFRSVNNVLETHDLVKYLQPVLTSQMSLKNLTKQYLNCNLLKGQQLSDWSRRPLSSHQQHYAACDALVLLRLHDAMVCEIEEKLCPSADSDTSSDNGTHTATTSDSQSSSADRESLAKTTIASLCRTVDFTITSQSNKAKPVKPNKIQKHKRSVDISEKDSNNSIAGTSVLFHGGWQSEPAKEWVKTQLLHAKQVLLPVGGEGKKRSLEEVVATSATVATNAKGSTNSGSAGEVDRCGDGQGDAKKSRVVSYEEVEDSGGVGSHGGGAFHLPLPAGMGKHVVYK